MNIKQKVEELYNKRFDYSFCCGGDYCDGDHNGGVKKDILEFANDLDLLYRKEMEKEIRGIKEGKIDIVKLKAEGVVNLQSWAEGYDQALEDVLDLISHKKTK